MLVRLGSRARNEIYKLLESDDRGYFRVKNRNTSDREKSKRTGGIYCYFFFFVAFIHWHLMIPVMHHGALVRSNLSNVLSLFLRSDHSIVVTIPLCVLHRRFLGGERNSHVGKWVSGARPALFEKAKKIAHPESKECYPKNRGGNRNK